MGVQARKIIALPVEHVIERNFECGTFDLLQESQPGNGWVEVWRDCDAWPKTRRTLYPYASGNNGLAISSPPQPAPAPFEKYFAATESEALFEFDLSDTNGGALPSNKTQIDVYQNGKWIPRRAFSVDYTTSVILTSPVTVKSRAIDACAVLMPTFPGLPNMPPIKGVLFVVNPLFQSIARLLFVVFPNPAA